MSWFLGEVELRADANWGRHPFGEQRFPTAVDMWIVYVQGNLAGHLAPAGDASRVLVVRQEDLLRRPDAVVDELARRGLPRNAVDFAPLETLVTGYQNATRQETLRREAVARSNLAVEVKRTIVVCLVSSGCER